MWTRPAPSLPPPTTVGWSLPSTQVQPRTQSWSPGLSWGLSSQEGSHSAPSTCCEAKFQVSVAEKRGHLPSTQPPLGRRGSTLHTAPLRYWGHDRLCLSSQGRGSTWRETSQGDLRLLPPSTEHPAPEPGLRDQGQAGPRTESSKSLPRKWASRATEYGEVQA